MHSSFVPIMILMAPCIAVVLFARWFDRKYYIPFLNETLNRYKKKPVDEPNLIGVGLMAAGGGLVIWLLIGCVWMWVI